MRILILGGTEFAGRAMAEEALRRGWQVTVFNRGRNPAPAGADARHGDRTTPEGRARLDQVAAESWDAVIDTWSAAPGAVHHAAAAFAATAGRYVYISSRSVYTYPAAAGLAEDGPVVDASPEAEEEPDYARAKRGAELAAETAFGERALLVRAGLILGPYENAGRLLWWLARIARGGTVLAPGPRDLALQYVDVRDLATWVLDAVVAGLSGPYNLVSESGHATIGQLLDTCVEVTGSSARLRWLAPDQVLAAGLEPWSQLPIWLPPGELYDTLYQGDVRKALEAGLRCRPVEETVTDTWAWLRQTGQQLSALYSDLGLDPDTEAKVLASLPEDVA